MASGVAKNHALPGYLLWFEAQQLNNAFCWLAAHIWKIVENSENRREPFVTHYWLAVRSKRKYTRKAKPRLPENPAKSVPAPEKNGQLPEAASTNEAASTEAVEAGGLIC